MNAQVSRQSGDFESWSRVVVKAWQDEGFKKRLLADSTTVVKEYGLEVPPGVHVRVVENTDQDFHLTLPDQPVAVGEAGRKPIDRNATTKQVAQYEVWGQILGQVWQDEGFKKRLLAQPATILKEYGLEVPSAARVHVVQNDAQLLHLTLPAKPAEIDVNRELSDEQLNLVAGGAAGPLMHISYASRCSWANVFGA